ncbi:nuclear RNA export factor 2 [Ochotona princeps]|uniref:nuclear RNA export factor 2 n=1 Tax=Ochotona princeps TaxID=9978 RepID=UPI0027149DA3|nr:nuclear RNA export factor 2 [Ochotona princeps]
MLPHANKQLEPSGSRLVLQDSESEKPQQEHAVPSIECETHASREHSEDTSSPVEDGNVGSTYQDNFSNEDIHYQHSGYQLLPSYLQQDVAMWTLPRDSQKQCTPYNVPHEKRTVKRSYTDQICVTVWIEKDSPEGPRNMKAQNETTDIWFKVLIPYGRNYNKIWLMKSIQSQCTVPFIPVDFHYIKHQARFFILNATSAVALSEVSHKIYDEENRTIPVFVLRSGVPYSVQNQFQPEKIEKLRLALNKRYSADQQSLDLQRLRLDPDLVGYHIDMILNRRNCMAATLQVIQTDFPELLSLNLSGNKLYQLNGLCEIVNKAPNVKILNLSTNELRSVWELDNVKELMLEELCLQVNPLCVTFPNHAAYISAVRECFPTLLRLDGQELLLPNVIDTDEPFTFQELPKGTEMLKKLILQFLQEYYFIYDYGDRRRLLDGYHRKAYISLTIPFEPMEPALIGLCEYFKDSRNMKYIQDPCLRIQMLQHTSHDIVQTLSILPRTQHNLDSFSLDLWFQTNTTVGFSVNGVFKGESNSQDYLFVFTQNFIMTPKNSSSLCILNDQLFVRDAIPDILSDFCIPSPNSNSGKKSNLTKLQLKMIQTFSVQSGMHTEWSEKCLEDSGWN